MKLLFFLILYLPFINSNYIICDSFYNQELLIKSTMVESDQVYKKSFPEYGFSIEAPCELKDVSAEVSGNFLFNYGGVTDPNDPAKMAAYQITAIRVPVGYRDLPKAEYENLIDNLLKSRGQAFKTWKPIRFGYEGYKGYVGETSISGYGQKGVIFVKDNLIIALTVITNNNLEQKFNKFTNGFKTL